MPLTLKLAFLAGAVPLFTAESVCVSAIFLSLYTSLCAPQRKERGEESVASNWVTPA